MTSGSLGSLDRLYPKISLAGLGVCAMVLWSPIRMKLKLHVPSTPSAFPPGSGHYDDGDAPAEKLALSGLPPKRRCECCHKRSPEPCRSAPQQPLPKASQGLHGGSYGWLLYLGPDDVIPKRNYCGHLELCSSGAACGGRGLLSSLWPPKSGPEFVVL